MISENYEPTKTDSKCPPSLQVSWENAFVVKTKRKRKKQSILKSVDFPPPSSASYSSSGIIMRNINPFKDIEEEGDEDIYDDGDRKSFFCGRRQPNATTMSNIYKNIFPLFLILVIFNTQITFQRPLHNSNVEEGSLTSAMVRIFSN